MTWAHAFDKHVREWIRQDRAAADVWAKYASGGYRDHGLLKAQVPGAAVSAGDVSRAYWSAFRYQRLHADSFALLLETHRFSEAVQGSVLVVDVGCGAGTVGVAVAESLPSPPPGAVCYVGFDHNQVMRSLATGILGESGMLPVGSTVDVLADPADAFAHAEDIAPSCTVVLVALSYFFNQPNVTDTTVMMLAAGVARLASRCHQPLRVCVTDPTGLGSGRFPAFAHHLARQAAVAVVMRDGNLTHSSRFPYLYADEGPMIIRPRSLPTVIYQFLRVTPR